MDLIFALKNIGFTQQEALLYIKLCEIGELSGYEAAKVTSISRSNAYASLSSLVDKGYVNIIEAQTNKYIAVPKDELIQNVTRKFEENIKTIDTLLEFNRVKSEPYITISKKENVVNKLRNIINAATSHIYISCNESILEMIEAELLKTIENEMKLVLLSPTSLKTDEDNYTYYRIKDDDYFKIISDTSVVLAGTLDQSLYSKNTTLVSIIRESFINEISVMNQRN